MSCLFVISSFWGYENLSKFCHVRSHGIWTENITKPTHTKRWKQRLFRSELQKSAWSKTTKILSLYHIICICQRVYNNMLE